MTAAARKTNNPSMAVVRSRIVGCGWVLSLAVGVACTSRGTDLVGGSSTEGGETTAVEPSSSSGASSSSSGSSSSGALDESTTAEEPSPPSCHDPRPIPPSRFDCSGVDGVVPTTVILEADDDPSVLAGVRRLEGSLFIDRTNVTDLDFMGCLEEVTGDVMIYGNDALTNVDGLWSLRSIGGNFVFGHNDALTDFDGLPNMEMMVGSVVIDGNASLEVVTGFHSLVGLVGETVNKYGNDETIGGSLSIRSNPALLDIDGLGRLVLLGGTFNVSHNPSLCMSSVDCVGSGIVEPETPPASWTTVGNDEGC